MNVSKIIEAIETKPLPRVLLVHGSEKIYHDRIFAALKKRNAMDSLGELNWSVFHGARDFVLEPLLHELSMVPWGDGTKIVVLKDADLIGAAVMEQLALWLEQNPKANCLALFLDRVDQRLKYVKVLRKFALQVACEPLEGERLIRYIQDYCQERGRTLKRETAELFLDRAGSDLLFVHNELDKLFALTVGEEEITASHVRSVTSFSPAQIEEYTVFRMTDSIVQKKRREALEVLNLLLKAGEPALRILPLIERQLRLVLAAKTAQGALDDAAKTMGERSSYPLKKMRKDAQKYSLQDVFAGFEAVLHADRQLKLGVPDEEVLTDLIIKLT
jgi:DNA polymerase-3 subunit delta